jgi:quercetin dioxygenase-like cupin family protein
MHWSSLVALLITVAVATMLGGELNPYARAQDATPASEQATGTPDAAFRPLASGTLELLAPGTANLGFGRVTLEPGARVAFDPMDPSAILVYIASGAVTFRVEAEMTVTRGGTAGTPVPAEPEVVAASTEFTLQKGDSALFPPAIAGEARNDGPEEATAWVVTVAAFADATGTPTP